MWVDVPVGLPPFYLPDREIVDHQPAPDPLMLGTEPEFAHKWFRERELPQAFDLVWEEIFIEWFRVYPVPGLPDFHYTECFRFEDEEIEREILVGVCDPLVSHPRGKSLRLLDCLYRFLSPCHHKHQLSDDTIVDSYSVCIPF